MTTEHHAVEIEELGQLWCSCGYHVMWSVQPTREAEEEVLAEHISKVTEAGLTE